MDRARVLAGLAWALFGAASAAVAVHASAAADGTAVAAPVPALPAARQRAVFRELATAESTLRRRLERQRPDWPWRAEHETQQAMARRWAQVAAREGVPLGAVARLVDEGTRAHWAPGMRAWVPPLAPVPPSARLR